MRPYLENWQILTRRFRAREAIRELEDIIMHGAVIGYVGPRDKRDTSAPSFYGTLSTEEHEFIEKEFASSVRLHQRMCLPAYLLLGIPLRVSPIFLRPKPTGDGYRLIFDLSHGWLLSINALISDVHNKYAALDDAVAMIMQLERGAYLSKFDVKAAFRCIPVHPRDRHLLVIRFGDRYYIELSLPFGLKSSPAIWERFGCMIEWIAVHEGHVRLVVRYVDDFLVAGDFRAAGAVLCAVMMALGIPLAVDKNAIDGMPSQVKTFLGVELDTRDWSARLGTDRLRDLRTALAEWRHKAAGSSRDLQSLVGKLNFAAAVIRPGRIFMRSLLDAVSSTSASHVVLTDEARADIAWWMDFAATWNGAAFMYLPANAQPRQLHVYTDASVKGAGAHHGSAWWALKWPADILERAQRVTHPSVPFLEMYAICIAAATWGSEWHRCTVTFHCDAKTTCAVIDKRDSTDADLRALIECFITTAATFNFDYRVEHIPGKENVIADALSRGRNQAPQHRGAHITT